MGEAAGVPLHLPAHYKYRFWEGICVHIMCMLLTITITFSWDHFCKWKIQCFSRQKNLYFAFNAFWDRENKGLQINSFQGSVRALNMSEALPLSYNAEIFLYKPLRPKCFFQFEIIINVLVSSFRFIWIPMLWVYIIIEWVIINILLL